MLIQRVEAIPAPACVAEPLHIDLPENRQQASPAAGLLAIKRPRVGMRKLNGGADVAVSSAVDVGLEKKPQELASAGFFAEFYAP